MTAELYYRKDFKTNFESGATDYVKFDGSVTDPKPDHYWNPRTGQWEERLSANYRFSYENLPKTGPLTYVKDFWGLFRRITDQWGTVPLAKQPFAYWNGIAREWVVVSAVTDPAGSGGTPDDKKARARREYEEALRYLKSLREANPALLTAEQFDKEVAELGDRYRERI